MHYSKKCLLSEEIKTDSFEDFIRNLKEICKFEITDCIIDEPIGTFVNINSGRISVGKPICIKFVDFKKMRTNADFQFLIREVELMSILNGPNFINMKGYINNKANVGLVLDVEPEAFNFKINPDIKRTDREIVRIFRCLVEASKELLTKYGLLNLFWNLDSLLLPKDQQPRIVSLKSLIHLEEVDLYVSPEDLMFNKYFLSPEISQEKKSSIGGKVNNLHSSRSSLEKIDLIKSVSYTIAMLTLSLIDLEKFKSFAEKNQGEKMAEKFFNKISNQIPKEIKGLIIQMLNLEPKIRMSFMEASNLMDTQLGKYVSYLNFC